MANEDERSAPGDASAEDPRAVYLMGRSQGRIEQKLDQLVAQNGRIEAQQTQILEQHNGFADEVSKLASEVVHIRERVTKLEAAPPGSGSEHRPPAASLTTEVKNSIRALDQKQDDQTVLLRALAKSPKTYATLFAIGLVLQGVIQGWLNSQRPNVVMAPVPMTAPAPALPRPSP